MRWPWRRRGVTPGTPADRPHAALEPADELPVFVCSACGRTDLPPAGDWDPPICLECDAAINEDALREEDDRLEPW